MKIAYYCQHVLGVGHLHRSLEICRACAIDNDVTMIVGGPPVDFSAEPFTIHQLPGLRMDVQFSGLIPCDEKTSLDNIKELRREKLLAFFREFTPDVLVIELFPFGRKAFRFELIPLLEAAGQSPCKIVCSLRDILVEKKQEQLKHERRAVETLNHYFDALLVHSDPQIVKLDETFNLFKQIQIPVRYTGFITPLTGDTSRKDIRKSLNLGQDDKLVIASIGSGSVGSELLDAVYAAATVMVKEKASPYHFHIFSGPYCNTDVFARLSKEKHERIAVERFTDRFVDWLTAADLSISMAGYNTSMNVLAAGVPALMMPFDQNREQRLRITKLTRSHPIELLNEIDLTTDQLIPLIEKQCSTSRYHTHINLMGALQTAEYLQILS